MHETIVNHVAGDGRKGLFKRGEKVAIGASGGKGEHSVRNSGMSGIRAKVAAGDVSV